MGCGASSDHPAEPIPNANAAAQANKGAGGDAASLPTITIHPREESYKQQEGQPGVATPAATPAAAASSAAPQSKLDKALAAAGKGIEIGQKASDIGNSVFDGALGALANSNPDGTYTLKDSIGPLPMDNPLLKSIASKVVFVASEGIKSTQAGVILFKLLESCYSMYMSHHNKPQWLAEFMLYLATVESEVREGTAQFRRQGFLLLLVEEIEVVRNTLTTIQSRSTMKSILFSSSDQEGLTASKMNIEKLKQQALQGFLIEIKEDTTLLQKDLKKMVADLKAQQQLQLQNNNSAAPVKNEVIEKEERKLKRAKLLPNLLKQQFFDADITSKNKEYFPGTRQSLMDDFASWLQFDYYKQQPQQQSPADAVDPAARVFALTANPGEGKSTWAAHVASEYASCVLGVHFCDHARPMRAEPINIIKSIFYQLIQAIPPLKEWFIDRLEMNDGALQKKLSAEINSGKDVLKFFEDYLVAGLQDVENRVQACIATAKSAGTPLDKALHAGDHLLPMCVVQSTENKREGEGGKVNMVPRSKVLILIDSLDESAHNSFGVPEDDIIGILSNTRVMDKLPPWIGFVVTSRLESRILQALQRYKPRLISSESKENLKDLDAYLRATLKTVLADPQEDLERALVVLKKKSAGSFLYASRVLKDAASGVEETGVKIPLSQLEKMPQGMNEWFEQTIIRIKQQFREANPDVGKKQQSSSDGGEDEDGDDDDDPDITSIDASLARLPKSPSFSHVKWILRLLISAHEPLSIASLAELTTSSIDVIDRTLQPLRSLLPLLDEGEGDNQNPVDVERQGAASSSGSTSSKTGAARVRLFHKSLRDWLTSKTLLLGQEGMAFFVDAALGHKRLYDVCISKLFVDPEKALSSGALGPSAPFPLVRTSDLNAAAAASAGRSSGGVGSSLTLYALHWGVRHALVLEQWVAVRHLLCSLQFLALRIDRNQTTDYLNDFNLALRILEGKQLHADQRSLLLAANEGGDSQPPRLGSSSALLNLKSQKSILASADNQKEILGTFRSMQRFLRAEIRHLLHGIEKERQAALTFQYAASYPATEMVSIQANQPTIKALWNTVGAFTVDRINWQNRPLTLSAMIESWTDIDGEILSLAFHPDPESSYLVTGGSNGAVCLWNITTSEMEYQWNVPGVKITGVAFMGNEGDVVTTVSEDGWIRAWDTTQPEPLAILPYLNDEGSNEHRPGTAQRPALRCVTFSSDESSSYVLAGGVDGSVFVYLRRSLKTLPPLRSSSTAAVTGLAYSNSLPTDRRGHLAVLSAGFLVATYADGSVAKWSFDLSSGEIQPAVVSFKHTAPIESITLSRDNKLLALGTRDGLVLILNAQNLSLLNTYKGHRGAVLCLDFNPMGTELISGGEEEVLRLWDVQSAACVSVYTGHHAPIQTVKYSVNGNRFASGACDESVRIWDPSVRALEAFKADSKQDNTCWNVQSLSLSDNNNNSSLFSTSEDKMLREWNIDNGQMIDAITGLDFVPHHFVLISSSATAGSASSKSASVASEKSYVIASRSGAQIDLYLNGDRKKRFEVGSNVNALTLSVDKSRFAAALANGTVKLFNISGAGATISASESGSYDLKIAKSVSIKSLSFGTSSDTLRVLLDNDSIITLQNGVASAAQSRALSSVSEGKTNTVQSGAFSTFDDRNLVATAAAADGIVHVWNCENGKLIRSLQTITRGVTQISWISSTGLFLAGGNFLTIVWDYASNTIPVQFFAHDDTVTSLVARDGRFITGSLDNEIIVWDARAIVSSTAASSSASSSSSSDAVTPLAQHTFIFETERAAPTGTCHIYECSAK